MTAQRTHTISGRNWSVTTLEHGSIVDILTAIIFTVWMVFAYSTIQQFGPTPSLILSVVVLGVVALLAIHGQYVTYIRFGSIQIGRRPPHARDQQGPPDDEK